MYYLSLEPEYTISVALVFGVITAIYGAILGIMGSLDYFYHSRSRFSILRITALSSILFSFVITVIGIISLTSNPYNSLWYATLLPGLLGLVIFISLFYIITRRNRFNMLDSHQQEYY